MPIRIFEIQTLKMNTLPVEIQARILWFLRQDAVSLHRIEHVCQLWADIVQFFETYRRLRFRTVKVCKLGVHVQNMKMDFNTGGTWRRSGQ